MTQPRIVRVIARLNVGGPSRHVVWLTAGLREEFDTTLVTGVIPPGEDDMSAFALTQGVVPVVIPSMSREISWKDILTLAQMVRLLRRIRPHIVHSHTAKAGTIARVAVLLYQMTVWRRPTCRSVHTYHGHIFHGYYGPRKTGLFLLIERLLARITDRIIVLGQQQLSEIHEGFRVGRPEQFQIVPLGIDLSLYQHWEARRNDLRHELKISDDEILVGIVGRLTEVKNHALFLESAARFLVERAGEPPRVRFLVIGDGHLRPDLEEQVRRLGIEAHVRFLGTRTDPESFYPGLDLIALTSVNEGTPLSLIEAMANGRPVISTAVGGVVDLAGERLDSPAPPLTELHEHALLVVSQSSEAFSRGLAYLVGEKTLRDQMGSRGPEFVGKQHSRERLLENMRRLYRELGARSEA